MRDERKYRSLAWLYSLLAPVYVLACGVPFYDRAPFPFTGTIERVHVRYAA